MEKHQTNTSSKKPITSLVGEKIMDFEVVKYINSGAFGDVYEAINTKTKEKIALKTPCSGEKAKQGVVYLKEELKIYKDIGLHEGIPKTKEITIGNKTYMAIQLLSVSLETKMKLSAKRRLKLKTVNLLAIDLLKILRYIHESGYVHRDIKPDNFMLNSEGNKLYCIDFGLAKKISTVPKTSKFCGTVRFASLSAHTGKEQTPKDDLESLAYNLIYMYKGYLPWQMIKEKDIEKKERYKLIRNMKANISCEELCKSMPREFLVFLKYTRSLDQGEDPRYSSLINMFKKLFDSKNYKDYEYEW